MSGKIFVWVGGPREVFKPEAKQTYQKGVPFTAPGLFEDLFEHDPMFVELDEKTHERLAQMWEKVDAIKDPGKKAKACADTLAKVLKILEPGAKAEMAKWRKARDEHRAQTPQPVQAGKTATSKGGDA